MPSTAGQVDANGTIESIDVGEEVNSGVEGVNGGFGIFESRTGLEVFGNVGAVGGLGVTNALESESNGL
jgi:hypothetical protein